MLRIGSREHYGWDEWYAVSVRHVFRDPSGGTSPSYAWLTGPRGPRGEALSLLVAARTPPGGWREPAVGQRLDVWAWPVGAEQAARWDRALAAGEDPDLPDPGRPQQWLEVVASGTAARPHPLERARMFRGLTFRGRTDASLSTGQVAQTVRGLATSADLRVATRNFTRTRIWCVLGDEGRVVGEKPGLAPLAEVFFLPGTRFRQLSAWKDDVPGHGLDVVLVHQLDSVRGDGVAPFVSPDDLPAYVRQLAARAVGEPPLRLRDEGRFVGPLT